MHPFWRISCAMIVVLGAPSVAWADGAREAYDRGVRAHGVGDHAAAARAFAEADAIAPSNASLEAALESAMRADDVGLGAELLERSESRPLDASSKKTVALARKRFAGRSGKLKVECGTATSCLASIEGVAFDAKKTIHVRAGAHRVVVERDQVRFERLVEVGADKTVLVDETPRAVEAPKPLPPREPTTDDTGLSPRYFWVGVVATTAAGAVTLGFGLHALSVHDRFERGNCNLGATGPRGSDCDSIARSGERAQTITNVALGTTAVLAVATTALGLWLVKWSQGAVRVTGTMTGDRAFAGIELVR